MKVLLAFDGSEPSAVARDLVANLSWPTDTVVHLVSASDVPVDWTGGVGSTMDLVGDVEAAMQDESTERLALAAEALVAKGLRVETVVSAGRAADVIIAEAGRIGADLIVTGSRGRGQLTSMLLGSVASEVVAYAPCPVLVARTPQVSRVLVATDGSRSAAHIPEWLGASGFLRGVPADAVAVSIPDDPAFKLLVGLYTLGDERLARQRAALRERYRADAEEMAQRLTAVGIPAEAMLRAGDPGHQILTTAVERGADLIVTGSRGRSGIERLLLGSVARNVAIHARCSVLVVRPPTTTQAA